MRKLLMIGAIGAALAFSAPAHATLSEQAAFSVLNLQAQAAFTGPQPVEEFAAMTTQVAAATRQEANGAPGNGAGSLVLRGALLLTAALAFGLAAVGAKSIWLSDHAEPSPFGDRR